MKRTHLVTILISHQMNAYKNFGNMILIAVYMKFVGHHKLGLQLSCCLNNSKQLSNADGRCFLVPKIHSTGL